MTRVSGHPEEMRLYVSRTDDVREEAYDTRLRLIEALEAFAAALPEGFTAPVRPGIVGPLGRTRRVDGHVSTVADRFEEAGSANGDGTYTVDDAVLAALPYTSQYSDTRREQLRRRAEEELATLRERINDGSLDETTTGELVATLAWMRHAIDTSPHPQTTAADLIDTMGAGDLHEALSLLEGAAHDTDDLDQGDWPVQGMQDLAFVVSVGLESQPARAARWAQDLTQRRDHYSDTSDAEGVALLAGFVAPGTQQVGRALLGELWMAGPLPDDGLVHQLYDTTSPLQPLLVNAAGDPGAGLPGNPELANGIVTDLLASGEEIDAQGRTRSSRFDVLFSTTNAQDHRFGDIPDRLLGDVLVAAVDPSLDPLDRGSTAYDLTTHYVEVAGDDARPRYGFSDEVTRGFAAATQPLLEAWESEGDGSIILPAGSPDGASYPDDDLWTAIGEYGERDAGVEGLRQALAGTTEARLVLAYEVGVQDLDPAAAAPHPSELVELAELNAHVAAEVGNERWETLVETASGGGPSEAAWSVLSGALGEAPGGDALVGLAEGFAQLQQDSAGADNPFAGIRPQMVYDLALLDLAARPDLATPEVVAGIDRALTEEGLSGAHGVLTDASRYPADQYGGPALTELRLLLADQVTMIGETQAAALAELTGSG